MAYKRKLPGKPLSSYWKKKLSQMFKGQTRRLAHWPLPRTVRLLQQGAYHGHKYMVLDLGSWEEMENPYIGIILPGGYTHEGFGFIKHYDLGHNPISEIKNELEGYPKASEFEDGSAYWASGSLHTVPTGRKGWRAAAGAKRRAKRRKNPGQVNTQNIAALALGALAAYNLTK